jgi:hypothetical protein
VAQAVAASVAAARAAEAAPVDATMTASAPPSLAPAEPTPSAASAQPAAQPVITPVPPRRDTVQVDGQPALPGHDSGGLGGLFANAEPLYAAPPPPSRPETSVFAQPDVPVQPPAVPVAEPEDDGEGRGRTRAVLLAVVAVVLVVAIGLLAWSMLRGPSGGSGNDGGASTAPGTSAAGPEIGTVQEVAGVAYTLEAAQVDDTCVGHSYGDTADFFATTDCTGVSRALYSARIDGGPIVVSVSRVRMADPAAARQLQELTDRNGSGNISDLLREGVRYAGSPAELSGAEYASALNASTVTIVESDWVDPDSSGSSTDIDLVASNGLALETQPLP